MRRATLLLALASLGCGEADDERMSAPDAATGDDGRVGFDAADPDGSAPPPAGDRLGAFGPAPSFYELLLDGSAASVDAFHFGTYRTGFTWPLPVVGDFDGDGFDSVGYYDPRAHLFHLHEDVEDAETTIAFGEGTRLPIAGDWDGDGVDSLGLYDPVTGSAELRDDNAVPGRVVAGPVGQFPVAADLNGDGVDALLYYDGSAFTTDERTVSLGPPDGYPFAGDFDGDGADGVGVFDLTTQTFHFWNDLQMAGAGEVVVMPRANWIRYPIAGRWRSVSARTPDTGFAYEHGSPSTLGIDEAGLERAAAALEAMPNLRSMLVLRDGVLAHESYFHGNRPDIAHNIKSVSKSILATVLLLAVADGIVADQPVVMLLPPALDDGDSRRRTIELDHLVTMTAGLTWNEDRIGEWFATDDWLTAAFSAAVATDPGTAFNYSTANTHIASAIVSRAAGMGTDVFARDRLLQPLGIVAERWDRDPQGTPVGGAEVTMRPRDMARLGELFLADGRPDATPLVDASIIDTIRTERIPASAIDGDLRYGAWWWMRTFGAADAYYAWGYGGQFIFVFPTLDAVVVVTSRSDVDGATSTVVSYDVFSVIAADIVRALGG